MNLGVLAIIGLFAMPAVVPVFMQHVKKATRFRSRSGSLWPLATDVAAVAWTIVLWRGGLLVKDVEVPEGVTLTLPVVVLIGITAGVACTLGYDGWQRFGPRKDASPTS